MLNQLISFVSKKFKKTLIIELIEDMNWLGGIVYIDNLLSTLSTLPRTARLRVNLKPLTSSRTAQTKQLFSHPVVRHPCWSDASLTKIRDWRRCYHVHKYVFRSFGNYILPTKNKLFFPVFDTRKHWRKNLYWIPDFQPHYLPELFEPHDLALRLENFKKIAYSNGILLLSSNTALKDFKKFYPTATIQPRVWSFSSNLESNSAEACHEVNARYSLPEKFLYIPNQFWQHKDHLTAFKALRILNDRGLKIPLVCTGLKNDHRNPEYFSMLLNMLESNALLDQVYLPGVVPRKDQIQFFRKSCAVLQPSKFEGWSTVLEDAKALGKPIIASDIEVHREQLINIDNTYFFKLMDATELANTIQNLWFSLPKGPNLDLERSAAERSKNNRLASAYEFLSIIEEAISYPN